MSKIHSNTAVTWLTFNLNCQIKKISLFEVCMIIVSMVCSCKIILIHQCYKINFQATTINCCFFVYMLSVFSFVLPAMRQWLLCMKNLLKKKAFHEESKWMTSVESYHVTHLIEIIWENLEDPVS